MVRRTTAQWAAILRAFDRSGVNQAEFARRRQLPVATLRWHLWRRRSAATDPAGAPATDGGDAAPAGFVELVAAPAVTLTLPSGAVLHLSALPPVGWLRALGEA